MKKPLRHPFIKKGRKKYLRYLFIFIIAVFALYFIFQYFQNTKTDKSSGITGWLHTKGTDIYNEKNRKITFSGINYNELTEEGYVYKKPDLTGLPAVCQKWSEPPVKLDATKVKEMGFNAVRLTLNWDNLEKSKPEKSENGTIVHNWNSKYLNSLDKTISELKSNQIAVILDMHQYLWSSAFKYIQSEDGEGCSGGGIPSWIYTDPSSTTFQKARCDFFGDKTFIYDNYSVQESFTDVWKMIVQRYKNDPTVVAADIINEPWMARQICDSKDLKLKEFYTKVGKEIRSVNPKIMLIFEDSQDFPDYPLALDGPLPFDNIVYSFHLYTGNWTPDGLSRMQKFYNRAREWGVPLFVGEFDGFGYAVNTPKDPIYQKKITDEITEMMKFMKTNSINWSFWTYSGYESILDPKTGEPKKDILNVLKLGF